ncbi:hypothetical protein [Spiroplasma floricola]|uniref:Holliday junction DNA helicase RuvA n=1 Tax=Spiroplasma floricola 23-6 TaxID=1336749 RepID=A0A2K8SDJ8_9MOLU|nr:hypothetical protein [Spiroplasma floricola]AUB31537.1 Holliday junction DNA helicase RuvA [Spiroplasma floricola 23-6]
MYYLKCTIKDISTDLIIIESANIGYKGFKLFNDFVEKEQEINLYVVNYKNEFINELLFFNKKESRDLCEILLNIKNVGITTIKKIFLKMKYEHFIKLCEEQHIDEIILKTKLSETICKKIVQEIRNKIFNEKYNVKQMRVINSLSKLGYKISDIYKSIQQIDFNLTEENILKSAILNLNSYGN